MHHGGFSRTHLTVVQTEYEVNRSIIGGCTPMQAENVVFCTLTRVPGPGLEMQYAILLICFLSSFASLGKVLVLEDENTDGCRPTKCRYTSYSQWYLKPQR